MTRRTARGRALAVLLATGLASGTLSAAAGTATADPGRPGVGSGSVGLDGADLGGGGLDGGGLDAAGLDSVKTTRTGTTAADKLGTHDLELLADAEADGEPSVTILLATREGEAQDVDGAVQRLGGTVGHRNDRLGYVRATVPTAAVTKAAGLRDVLAVDLNDHVELPDPQPERGAAAAAKATARAAGPGAGTPDQNPYLPTYETGAVLFKQQHPSWDGRGITVGILDTGVDLDHPALQTTTTGERKIVDWVTATDPLVEGDPTWLAMLTEVSGPTFAIAGRTWTAPAGEYLFNHFVEASTAGSELGGDVNRDGDTEDTFGVLYRPSDKAIWVDADSDGDFADEPLMRPYAVDHQVGHFGTDDPGTAVREQIPFVVEHREDVDLSPLGGSYDGRSADFVNIGLVADAHGSHVAGIAAAHGMFGGDMDGAAPGAQLVSSRACTFAGSCTAVALTEGMIDLVVNRGVDVVNMSIGGLPALNDGQNARAYLYNRLVDEFGVQIFISAGNSGPGLNTVGDPSVAEDVVSVGATISRPTWLANYGSVVEDLVQPFNFSSRGATEDGGFKPDITAPGSAISTIPVWQPGAAVPEAGYDLPPGYAMLNGTSMASPQAAGDAALLLSAGRATELPITPAQLRTAIYSTAYHVPGIPAYVQGNGQFNVPETWSLLRRGVEVQDYEVTAPVCTPISPFLVTPDQGRGIFNRCAADAGGHAPGQAKSYQLTVTRTSGPAGLRTHRLSWVGNDGVFSPSAGTLRLEKDVPVTFSVTARPPAGAHGAILQIDDPATTGIDHVVMNTVVAAIPLSAPGHRQETPGSVERNGTDSYFITVPEGASALQINLSGITTGSQTRFIAFNPYGVPVESTSSSRCFTRYGDPRACRATSRAYLDPVPGVWEVEVEARRTSPFLDNPYTIAAAVQGVRVQPALVEVDDAEAGGETPVSWTVTNAFGPVIAIGKGGPLGSARTEGSTIGAGETRTTTVTVPEGATRLDVSIGGTSDRAADLDLTVYRDGARVAQDADGDSEESVSIADPAPGTYTIEVYGYAVPSGETGYDYRDVFFSPSLGRLTVNGTAHRLDTGGSAVVTGAVIPSSPAGAGRRLFGEMTVISAEDAVLGRAAVVVGEVRG